jgi:hypothetical protein
MDRRYEYKLASVASGAAASIAIAEGFASDNPRGHPRGRNAAGSAAPSRLTHASTRNTLLTAACDGWAMVGAFLCRQAFPLSDGTPCPPPLHLNIFSEGCLQRCSLFLFFSRLSFSQQVQ